MHKKYIADYFDMNIYGTAILRLVVAVRRKGWGGGAGAAWETTGPYVASSSSLPPSTILYMMITRRSVQKALIA